MHYGSFDQFCVQIRTWACNCTTLLVFISKNCLLSQ